MFVWTLRFGSSPGSGNGENPPAVLQSAFPVHLLLWEDKLLDLGESRTDKVTHLAGNRSARRAALTPSSQNFYHNSGYQ